MPSRDTVLFAKPLELTSQQKQKFKQLCSDCEDMNILPKKRWHVRTKDNIARVRRDEAEARDGERKKQEKLQYAESEARINFLRNRSGLPEIHNEVVTDGPNVTNEPQGHVNLFADYKAHVKTTNKDLEKEKKEEQEKYEKQIGYLTYLGQDTNEALRLTSWYEVAPRRVQVGEERDVVEKDASKKINHDPLTLIKALLPPEPKPEQKTHSDRKRVASSPLRTSHEDSPSRANRSKKHKRENKRCKKEKHKKYRREKSEHKNEDSRLKLEKLRKERLRREATEKARQEALLAPKETREQKESSTTAARRVVQKYNSQFNPELAKQNMG